MKVAATRALSLTIVGAASLLVFAIALEPLNFEVTTHVVAEDPQSKVRIVQISDLHIQHFGERESQLVQTIRDLKPNVIALTGDIIDNPENQQSLASFLAALEPISRVAVLGNWEYWSGINIGCLRKIYESSPESHLLIAGPIWPIWGVGVRWGLGLGIFQQPLHLGEVEPKGPSHPANAPRLQAI